MRNFSKLEIEGFLVFRTGSLLSRVQNNVVPSLILHNFVELCPSTLVLLSYLLAFQGFLVNLKEHFFFLLCIPITIASLKSFIILVYPSGI